MSESPFGASSSFQANRRSCAGMPRSARNVCSVSEYQELAFTRYCHYQYCMVHGIQTGGREGGRILRNYRAIVLQKCAQCRWAGGMKG